jgi:hypothetical protein
MATPATRTPVRIARGTYSNLNASILDLLEGEVCYATDENKIYVVEGGALTEQAFLDTADIGTTVQGYDADTAKTDAVQSFTAAQRGSVVTLTPAATVTPDFAAGNNFSLALDQNTTIANPTNLTAGQSGSITITQDSTARTVSYGNYFYFEGGIPTFGTTTGAVSTLVYYVNSSTRITAALISEPTNT